MPARGQALTITYLAWDTGNNVGKTGDVSNHTLRWIMDGTLDTPDNSPAEVDATNAPGVYKITLTAAECTAWYGRLVGKSTGNTVIMPERVTFEATSVTVSDKTGFSVSQTGLDAVLKTTTFALAMGDAIWDEPMAGHTTADFAGLVMNDWQDGGRLDVLLDAVKVVTDALTSAAATKLALSAGTIVTGAAEAGTLSTTQMSTDLSEATDDHYNGRIIIWTSGVLQNQATDITDYESTAGVLTYTAVTEAPTAADTFIIL